MQGPPRSAAPGLAYVGCRLVKIGRLHHGFGELPWGFLRRVVTHAPGDDAMDVRAGELRAIRSRHRPRHVLIGKPRTAKPHRARE